MINAKSRARSEKNKKALIMSIISLAILGLLKIFRSNFFSFKIQINFRS